MISRPARRSRKCCCSMRSAQPQPADETYRKKQAEGKLGKTPCWPVSASLFQLYQHLPRDLFQGFENTLPLEGHGFDHRLVLALEFFRKRLNGKDVGKIALVEL